MEWYITILEEWKYGKCLRRCSAIVAVSVLFYFLLSTVADEPVVPQRYEKVGQTTVETVKAETVTVSDSVMPQTTQKEEREVFAASESAKETDELFPVQSNLPFETEPVQDFVAETVPEEEIVPDIPADIPAEEEQAPDIPADIPAGEEQAPDIPADIPTGEEQAPDMPANTENLPDIPADKDTVSDMSETEVEADSSVLEKEEGSTDTGNELGNMNGVTVISGFYVDQAGMICGIADVNVAVSCGYMELPSEGCTGIAAGAFCDAPAGIEEVYIPACITRIEEGAFSGLNEVGWFETEEGGEMASFEGVLFTENGTCLFAFPAGRTGIYQLPEMTVRIAENAFAGTALEKIDMRKCSVTDTGNVPEELIRF